MDTGDRCVCPSLRPLPLEGLRRVESKVKDLAHVPAREGDERLSGTSKASGGRGVSDTGQPDKKTRKEKRAPIGRALRSVYDDTLREEVPKDFLDLLGKLD